MTGREPSKSETPLFLRGKFLSTTFVGSLAMALVSIFGSLSAQVAVLGAVISALCGAVFVLAGDAKRTKQDLKRSLSTAGIPANLGTDGELSSSLKRLTQALDDLASRDDPVLREAAMLRLAALVPEVEQLADGTVVFERTETWRVAYETLLRSPEIKKYRSVAWVRSADYWRDAPGEKGMQVNYDVVYEGTLIERIAIIPESLWPADENFPIRSVCEWIDQQHNKGIWMLLSRENDLRAEDDLCMDFGIYGDRIVGEQELDESCMTVRFALRFATESTRIAEDRWNRLLLYATHYAKLLDQFGDPL